MTIAYNFSPETLLQGAKEYLSHRQRVLTILLPILGLLFLLFGLYSWFGLGEPNYLSGSILSSIGVFYLIWPLYRPKKMVKNTFKANPNERIVTIVASEKLLSFTDGENSGTSIWSAFVDFKICKTGILIYPQKNIFYWIPKTATMEGGTWQDFENLISSKITRKI